MAQRQLHLEHVLRRAGFGASPADLERLGTMSMSGAIAHVLDYDDRPDDTDRRIGTTGFAGITARGAVGFQPALNIEDARQRWLFRMVHSERPLQEKMALFWHNHFATAYSKLAGIVGAPMATKMMALKRGELPGPQGQLELFREHALGTFRDLLVEVAKDPAMLYWLDGRTNTRQRPQENFGREIMELFTFGIGNYTELDVYAAARVFTGWNARFQNSGSDDLNYYEFQYIAANHDPGEKTFTFPIYSNGSQTIPARPPASGMQDGLDFITALATHPKTAERLARRMWNYFISEVREPDPAYVSAAAGIYLTTGTSIRALVQYTLQSPWFQSPANWHGRYAWPVEFVVRAIKEVGWVGYSLDSARVPLTQMGQTLFEPPDVNGWELGKGWFSTGSMLSRMNFASALAANQRVNLAAAAAGVRDTPEAFAEYFFDRLSAAPYSGEARDALVGYLTTGGAWTGSDAQLRTKAAGLVHLVVGSGEYQLV